MRLGSYIAGAAHPSPALARRSAVELIIARPCSHPLPSPAMQMVLFEIAIMKKLSHPNVVRLQEVIDDPDDGKLYMVLEYVGKGPIYNYKPNGPNAPLPIATSCVRSAGARRSVAIMWACGAALMAACTSAEEELGD